MDFLFDELEPSFHLYDAIGAFRVEGKEAGDIPPTARYSYSRDCTRCSALLAAASAHLMSQHLRSIRSLARTS